MALLETRSGLDEYEMLFLGYPLGAFGFDGIRILNLVWRSSKLHATRQATRRSLVWEIYP